MGRYGLAPRQRVLVFVIALLFTLLPHQKECLRADAAAAVSVADVLGDEYKSVGGYAYEDGDGWVLMVAATPNVHGAIFIRVTGELEDPDVVSLILEDRVFDNGRGQVGRSGVDDYETARIGRIPTEIGWIPAKAELKACLAKRRG